jgi:hypothetical protein
VHGPAVRLAHDEHPSREQLRDFVRVPILGAVFLRLTDLGRGLDPAISGSVLDVSIGGMALETQEALRVEVPILCSFRFDGHDFRDVPATVLDCQARGEGFRARLKFGRVPGDDERRLATIVTRHSVRPPTWA